MRTTAYNWDQGLRIARVAFAAQYDVQRVVGVGAMASVYAATRLADGVMVALKVMHSGLMSDERNVARFEREARATMRLDHPHIVRVHAAGEQDGLHYMDMALVAGPTLTRLMGERREMLPFAYVLHWLTQIGAALRHAHGLDIVHRDLNPSNILLNEDGDAHVSDFGIAAVPGEAGLTDVGGMVGTPAYMSPEQLDGREATRASDQYALGVVAYELIAGRRPFYGSTTTVIDAHRTELPAPLTRWRPDCAPSSSDAVARMLDKEPALRFSDIAHALEALGAKQLPATDPQRAALRALITVDA